MNILIFSASTGGGHKRAAAALEEKIKEVNPESTVNVVDGLRSIGKVYDKTVCKGYYIMATKTPKVYGKFYKITDQKNKFYKTVMKSNSMMAKKLLETIEEYNPDVLIMCHPFISAMVSKLKKKGKITIKAISLITDYDSHRTYISPNIDAYVLAEPQMAKKLHEEYGVDESKIYPLGMLNIAVPLSLGVMEYSNAAGIIVCLPTGGSSGIVPAAIFSAASGTATAAETMVKAFLTAGVIGVIMARTNNFSGGALGCQAEIGCGAAMAAAALVQMLG